MPFNFQEDSLEPDGEPSGESTYIFKKFGSDEYEEHEADSLRAAWDGIRFNHGSEWKKWMCIGTEETVRYSTEVTEIDKRNVKYGVPGSHPVEFAALYPDTVGVWEDM